MKRLAVALVVPPVLLLSTGCVVATTVAVAGSVAVTAVGTAGRVTAATVKAGGRVVTAVAGPAAALTPKTAAALARPGAVVLVDASDGARREVPWWEGLDLRAAVPPERRDGTYRSVRLFRQGREQTAGFPRKKDRKGGLLLQPGDVVELRR